VELLISSPAQRITQALYLPSGGEIVPAVRMQVTVGGSEMALVSGVFFRGNAFVKSAIDLGSNGSPAKACETQKERCRYIGVTNSALARNMLPNTQVPARSYVA
jgi:hypothetical protein